MAPTMVACALAGFLTARFFLAGQPRHRLLLAGAYRSPHRGVREFQIAEFVAVIRLFVCFSPFHFYGPVKSRLALQGALFGAALLAGMAPTLIANAINAGSPFSTTYGGVDVTPPELNFGIVWQYVADMQFVLLVLAGAWTVLMWRSNRRDGMSRIALVTAGNLAAQHGLLPEPSDLHAVLHDPHRHAFVVEPAVCIAAAAGGSRGRQPSRAGGKGLIVIWSLSRRISGGHLGNDTIIDADRRSGAVFQ